ncbi:hypothetical protein [Bradyrhizobium vignae]|uniref:hypothetical protein n=1 Tax=Bradyrhizobium vignae TaxID=1549949 RepID=UPI001FD73430|nr:hypothetical protein [Bradyrhizobium vignae]
MALQAYEQRTTRAKVTVRTELDNPAAEPAAPSTVVIDWPGLLAGSTLARSDQRIAREPRSESELQRSV